MTKIQIVYAQGTQEIFNRRSALGSYIHCLSEIFINKGYLLRINELFFCEARKAATNNRQVKPGGAKRIIPLSAREFLKDVLLFLKHKKLLKHIEADLEFDCIIEFYTYGSLVGFTLCETYKKPMVLVYDAPVWEAHRYFGKGSLFFKNIIERREKKSLFAASSIVVYSNSVKEYLEKKYLRSFPVKIHQNVDYSRFEFITSKPDYETINIGFLGSFLKWHNVELLLEAFTALRDKGYQLNLYLLGSGEEYAKILELIHKNPHKTHIFAPGFLDGAELLVYKQLIHIGVMPGSNWYGAPNKLFEYGASFMAAIAPDTPTIRDLFEKEVMLFKNNSLEGLYNCLQYLCDHKEEIGKLAEKLQQKIKNNYSENITFNFYNELVTQNNI